MSEQLIEKPFNELVDSVSSRSAAPGGGSIAAAAGALGAGLVAMACKFTIGNEKYQDQWDEFTKILAEVEKYRLELIELVDKDSEAYNGKGERKYDHRYRRRRSNGICGCHWSHS